MKKIIAKILMILYVIPLIGISITVHYCGGEISSISWFQTQDDKCDCGSEKMKGDCCQDKSFTFIANFEQIKSNKISDEVFNVVFFELPKVEQIFKHFDVSRLSQRKLYWQHPPNLYTDPLFILNSVYRI